MNKTLPLICPSCNSVLKVEKLFCENCETEVTGLYSLPVISQLSIDDQNFILDFIKASGSLKIMAQNMKLSYPTVRNKLDDIINGIKKIETDEDQLSG